MSKAFHKEPLFIKARKENEKHKKFTEKVFYPKDNHASASKAMNNITNKIKFIIILVAMMLLAIFSYIFITAKESDVNSKKAELQDKKEDINNNNLSTENVSDSDITPQKGD